MSSKISVQEVLATLEQRAAFHREQEALHAQKAAQHQTEQAALALIRHPPYQNRPFRVFKKQDAQEGHPLLGLHARIPKNPLPAL